ncbi:MAG: DUF4435 domain-containing protein [Crocosphaera sp.]
MNQNNDISADYLRQQQEIPEGYFILFDELYHHDPKLLFCFFEGPDDINYYGSRIRDYSRCEFQEFYCDGKENVIDRFQYISRKTQTPYYNNAKIAYFIDKDFDQSIYQSSEMENTEKIYETPYYSIENFYTSLDCFKRILKEKFKIQQYLTGGQILKINPDFENSVKLYEQKQQEFHNCIGILNAYILCLKEKNGNPTSKFRVTDNKNKLKQTLIEMSPNNVVEERNKTIERKYYFEDLSRIIKSEIFLENHPSQPEVEQKLEQLKIQECQKSFRGKFEIEFLYKFLVYLKGDATRKNQPPQFFSRRINISFNLDEKTILDNLSKQAETPPCLVEYLEKFK